MIEVDWAMRVYLNIPESFTSLLQIPQTCGTLNRGSRQTEQKRKHGMGIECVGPEGQQGVSLQLLRRDVELQVSLSLGISLEHDRRSKPEPRSVKTRPQLAAAAP